MLNNIKNFIILATMTNAAIKASLLGSRSPSGQPWIYSAVQAALHSECWAIMLSLFNIFSETCSHVHQAGLKLAMEVRTTLIWLPDETHSCCNHRLVRLFKPRTPLEEIWSHTCIVFHGQKWLRLLHKTFPNIASSTVWQSTFLTFI